MQNILWKGAPGKPMNAWIPWLVAAGSTAAALFLWFREARRVLDGLKSTVTCAAAQLAACRRKLADGERGEDAAAVLRRSESIYTQAVTHYNAALHKPWLYLPGQLLGFQPVKL